MKIKKKIIYLQFDKSDRLLTCTENGSLRVWKISVNGEKAPLLEVIFDSLKRFKNTKSNF